MSYFRPLTGARELFPVSVRSLGTVYLLLWGIVGLWLYHGFHFLPSFLEPSAPVSDGFPYLLEPALSPCPGI